MTARKIRIPNERLWDIAQAGEDIDAWLVSNVGHGNYREWFGLTNLPYRSFSFKDPKYETLFVLRWLS